MKRTMRQSFLIRRFLRRLLACAAYIVVLAPAWATADNCDNVADYSDWTECVRHEGIASDTRLNLAYQKLMDKLRGDVDVINHLRDAQRRWTAFRDAQCALEGLASGDGRLRSTIASECFDRIITQRTDDLFSMLTCKEGDLTCSKPASRDVPSQTARTDSAVLPTGALPSGIPFESHDIIEKLKVSGVWFPELIKPYVGLSGPATFVFSNVETGETFSAAVNGVALLSEDFWKKHGVPDLNGLDISALIDKLKAAGVVEVPLSPETRAKIISCDSKAGDPTQADSQGDKCLQLGSAAVDIQDVEFDGKKQFVFRQAGQSQRGVDAYEIMELPCDDKSLQRKSLGSPWSELDQLSTINISKRQIILQMSNGACSSGNATYAVDRKQGPGMRLIESQHFSTGPDGTCYLEDYVAMKHSEGDGYYLKLKSRKPVN